VITGIQHHNNADLSLSHENAKLTAVMVIVKQTSRYRSGVAVVP